MRDGDLKRTSVAALLDRRDSSSSVRFFRKEPPLSPRRRAAVTKKDARPNPRARVRLFLHLVFSP